MEKRYEPGKKVSLRLTKDLPRYFFDFLNENEVGNRELLDLLLEGVQARMAGEGKGIFLPFDLPPDRREEVARNDDFLQTVVKVADWLIRGGGPPQAATVVEAQEGSKAPEPEPAPGEIDDSEDGYVNQFLQQFEDDDDEDD